MSAKFVIIIHLLWVKMSSNNPILGIMNTKSLTKPNFTDWLRKLNLSTRAIEYANC